MHLHPESHMDADSISLGLYSECGRGEYFDSFSYFRLISGSNWLRIRTLDSYRKKLATLVLSLSLFAL